MCFANNGRKLYAYSQVVQLTEHSERVEHRIKRTQFTDFGHCHDGGCASRKLDDAHAVNLDLWT
jgi:hypothetical protein